MVEANPSYGQYVSGKYVLHTLELWGCVRTTRMLVWIDWEEEFPALGVTLGDKEQAVNLKVTELIREWGVVEWGPEMWLNVRVNR
jgi:hypothetical protein